MIRDEIFDVIFVIRRVDYPVSSVENLWAREKIFHPFPKKKPYARRRRRFLLEQPQHRVLPSRRQVRLLQDWPTTIMKNKTKLSFTCSLLCLWMRKICGYSILISGFFALQISKVRMQGMNLNIISHCVKNMLNGYRKEQSTLPPSAVTKIQSSGPIVNVPIVNKSSFSGKLSLPL